MKCPLCESQQLRQVVQRDEQALSAFVDDRDLRERMPLVAMHCLDCQFVFLETGQQSTDFDRVMKRTYEGYLLLDHCGKTFPIDRKDYAYALDFLLGSVDFGAVQNALEVGSNRGDFLFHLKTSQTHLNVLGVEPARLPFFGVPTLHAYFDPGLIASRFDLILARHVLEHIQFPRAFVRGLVECLAEGGKLFLEVPNLASELRAVVEPFILEHTGYYTAPSMTRLLEGEGLHVEAMLDVPGHHLCVVASRQTQGLPPPQDAVLAELLAAYAREVEAGAVAIRRAVEEGWRLAFFGAGNIYLATYSALRQVLGTALDEAICAVVDDSPHRQGRTYNGHRVVGSASLTTQNLDRLLVIPCTMNRADAERMSRRARTWPARQIQVFVPWGGEVS